MDLPLLHHTTFPLLEGVSFVHDMISYRSRTVTFWASFHSGQDEPRSCGQLRGHQHPGPLALAATAPVRSFCPTPSHGIRSCSHLERAHQNGRLRHPKLVPPARSSLFSLPICARWTHLTTAGTHLMTLASSMLPLMISSSTLIGFRRRQISPATAFQLRRLEKKWTIQLSLHLRHH